MVAEGRSINVTLVFSLARYRQVLEAYLSGLEALARRGGDLSTVRGVASFFVSRVDTEVDRRLEEIGTDEALALRGRAAVAQAKLAYRLFREAHTGARWERLADRGARVQRPLWASTSTKNPRYPDTLYVDSLIGPDTVNTLPESTLQAFEDHGRLARTIDVGLGAAELVMHALAKAGVDMDDVGHTLGGEGIAAFQASFAHVLGTLEAKSHSRSPGRVTGTVARLRRRRGLGRGLGGWAVFGLLATAVLTGLMIAAQLSGLSRLDLPLILGTVVTPDPDRARAAGSLIHLLVGQVFALGYAASFALLGQATWWLGGCSGSSTARSR